MASTKNFRFDILQKPLITEKTAAVGTVSNSVVFEVHPRANKAEIADAVERIFDVKVSKVRTSNSLGKLKRVRTKMGRKRAVKKAYVTLAEGSSVNVIEGL